MVCFGIFVYAAFDPARMAVFPRCPFFRLTGFRCPGCGSQRALHQLLHGDFATALSYNAFLVLVLVGFIGWMALQNFVKPIEKRRVGYLLVIVVALWTVLRNIFGW